MTTSTISIQVNIIGALTISIGGVYLLIKDPILIDNFLGKAAIIYTLLGAIVTIIWHGINRLNSFDDLDGLKKEHITIIQIKVTSIKKSLHGRVIWLLLTALFLFVFSIIKDIIPYGNIIFSVVIPFTLMTIWSNIVSYGKFYLLIDELRRKVSELRQKEKARKKLIDELIKDRQSQPLISDPHLESYKKIFEK